MNHSLSPMTRLIIRFTLLAGLLALAIVSKARDQTAPTEPPAGFHAAAYQQTHAGPRAAR
jgi:hypothetical protein